MADAERFKTPWSDLSYKTMKDIFSKAGERTLTAKLARRVDVLLESKKQHLLETTRLQETMWPRLRDNICCCYVCHVLDSIARDLNLEQTTAERRQLVSLQKLLSRVFATLNSLPAPTRRTLGGYVLRFKKQADFDTLSKKVEPALTALKQGVDALCARETRADLEKRLKELPDADELSNKYGVPTTEAPRISEKMKQDIERRLQALKGGRPHKHGLDLFICRLNENYEMIPDRTTRRNRQFIVAVLSAFRLAHDPKTLDRALKKKKQFAGSMTVRPKSFSTGRFACTP